MKFRTAVFTLLSVALAASAVPVTAQTNKTPDITSSSWSTDRYDPCTFSVTAGGVQIGVCTSDDQANRPPAYSSSFYNYQGKATPIDPVGTTPSSDQFISLDLYVDPSWATNAGGNVTTGMWTRVNQIGSDDESVAWYPILGFSNSSGVGLFEYWNSLSGWETSTATVNYGAWNNFMIDYQGNSFTASVNGATIATETADPGTERLTSLLLEAYNDGTPYTASWRNASPETAVTPEPATMSMLAMGLVGMGGAGFRRRRRKSA